MLGAIAGDIIGSVYEGKQANRIDFELFNPSCEFTDDTVLTVAVADSLLTGISYRNKLKEYYLLYPGAGYGGAFRHWGSSKGSEPYNSFGNGSAMRVSPVAYAYNDLDSILEEAERSASVTHNHPEGIRGALAVAAAIFWARQGMQKQDIRQAVERRFYYGLDQRVEDMHVNYRFDVTCQGSVPRAIIAFLESTDFEDAIRKAIYIGGDSDTLACIAGGIAEAFYGGVPVKILSKVFEILDNHLLQVSQLFYDRFVGSFPKLDLDHEGWV